MDSDTACQIYRCFCELPRLRILNLLRHGPLCVCHLQEILQEPQVKISKHLAYLRTSGLVECRRRANWSIYSLASRPSAILEQNLKCLQDLQSEDPVFKADFKRLRKVDTSAAGCA